MAHFAEIIDNKVVQVLVVPDDQEHRGQEYLAEDCQLHGIWIQTSYNARIRKHYAGIGYTYNSTLDAFYPSQPYPSWTLDADCNWQPPTSRPDGEGFYTWNETTQEWETP